MLTHRPRAGLNVYNERARLREAERLVRELKMENEFLKKVIMPAGAGTRTG